MRLLTDVDGDEVSPVRRAANRRRFILKGDNDVDNELDDILSVPWEREGALLDEIRKDGITDDTVEKAVVAAIRLLKGVEGEFSPELIEKLGTELYGRKNPKLNTGKGNGGGGEMFGSEGSDDDNDGHAKGPKKDGSGKDGELSGTGSAPKVAADNNWNDNDDDDLKKRDFSAGDRKDLAGQGKALPDGSFPIENTGDLKNAIRLYGKAKNPGRAKAFIIRSARRLGATGMLPDSWKVSKADDEDWEGYVFEEHDLSDIEKTMDTIDNSEGGTVEVQVPVRKEDGTWDFSGVPADNRPFYEEMILKAETAEKELKETREQLAKADDELRTRSMIEKAAAYSHVAPADDLAPILKSVDDETRDKLEALLAAAEERISKGDLFKEMGSRTNEEAPKSGAYESAVTKANELIEKAENLSMDQALDRVFQANPDLYNDYLAESGMGVS